MKAIILAAGQGTRLRPLTYDMPKPMIPVLGRPVMDYLVRHLASHGVTDIMVNVSHLGYRIEQYFGDGSRHGVNIGYSFEGHLENGEVVPAPVGSAGALRKIQDFGGFIDDTLVVVCGDAIIDLDVSAALAEHRARGALASVIAKEVPWEAVPSYGVIEADASGRIVSFQEKPRREDARSNWASTGIYILEPEAVALVPPGRPFDIGSELFPMLAERGLPFFVQRHDFNWIDIGQASDYLKVVMELLAKPVAGAAIPGAEVRPGVWCGLNVKVNWEKVDVRGPVYIGAGTQIEDGARILGPAWIGHGSRVERDATVSRVVTFEYSRVSARAHLEDAIISGRYCVDREGRSLFRDEGHRNWAWGDARLLGAAA